MDIVRECPDCPDRFYVIDEQPEIVHLSGPEGIRFAVYRTAWEVEMMRHWRERHPGRMEALGMTEEAVIAEANAIMDRMVRHVTERFTSPPN
jgi:hypothetical protein